jgi:long-chain acyl-CoA synthetase
MLNLLNDRSVKTSEAAVEGRWLAHYDPEVPPSLDYPDITLPELFDITAARYPERVATIFQGARLRYRELQEQIDAFARGLHRLGIERGDRVALMLPNMPQFVVAFYGILKAGAVVVPTNPLYTQHELEHQLADAGACVIVTLDPFFPRVQAALPATQIRLAIVASIAAALPRHLRPLFSVKQLQAGIRTVPPGGVVRRFERVLSGRGLSPPGGSTADELAVLQYTGGTTGRAKGAMLSHRNLLANALQAHAWHAEEQDAEVTTLCAAPFFHVYGLTIGMNLSIASGATMLLVPRFIPGEVAKIAAKYRPELFPGVPTMYVALSNLAGFSARQFGSLRVCISGAAPLPPEVQRRFQDVSDVKLGEGYGLTEASPVTHCNPIHGDCRLGTVGLPLPDTSAMVTDSETWEPLPAGAVGELTVSGPQVMAGYWNRPQETTDVLRGGWLRTGDLATVDADGYFRIVDRKKDLIIAGGYNVYPREVEDVLYAHPQVQEAAVIGVPDLYRGETVKAVIALHEGADTTAEEIIAYCRRELAAYKVPRIVEFKEELPKSLVGKVLRRELRSAPDRPQEQTAASARSAAKPVA